jgi:hypothetical protein
VFAVVGLILAIAPFYIAWKILEFSFELAVDVIDRRRKRKAERQAQERDEHEEWSERHEPGFGHLVYRLLLGGGIGLGLALIIGHFMSTY